MKWLQNAYTRRFNTRHREWGRLFGDRYKSVVVEGRDPWYYTTLLDYIHLNPVRAGIIKPRLGESVREYEWSSVASGYAIPAKQRAPWLVAADGLASFDLPDTTDGRRRFVERLDDRARDEVRKECGVAPAPEDGRVSSLKEGWYWGTQAFREKLIGMVEGVVKVRRSRNYRGSPAQRGHDEKAAEAIVTAELETHKLSEEELPNLPGSERRKLAIALEVRTKTAVSLSWIAERLKMRSAANVSQQLRRLKSTSH